MPKENHNGDSGGEKVEDFPKGAALRCPDLLIGEFKTAERSVQLPPS